MNIFLNEYFGFCFELNHFSARFNEKMNFQNLSNRAISNYVVIYASYHIPHYLDVDHDEDHYDYQYLVNEL